jgi:hypothetical protein
MDDVGGLVGECAVTVGDRGPGTDEGGGDGGLLDPYRVLAANRHDRHIGGVAVFVIGFVGSPSANQIIRSVDR